MTVYGAEFVRNKCVYFDTSLTIERLVIMIVSGGISQRVLPKP